MSQLRDRWPIDVAEGRKPSGEIRRRTGRLASLRCNGVRICQRVTRLAFATLFVAAIVGATPTPLFAQDDGEAELSETNATEPKEHITPIIPDADEDAPPEDCATSGFTRYDALLASLTIFVLAVFVGFEVITKVPPTLHTPLMSGSNAISGITIVGALLATGYGGNWFVSLVGMIALVLASINVVGGFLVTHRMLEMFKKK